MLSQPVASGSPVWAPDMGHLLLAVPDGMTTGASWTVSAAAAAA